ncbi:cyclic nucleotide-binding domain-containing protein [Azospirillum sp. CT11-132]|uniref:cyclic nucleotide-binding domain-containing protein n=1 Tax=Azospirillum sp. CT11-132 TaxID=3396317 RepID=UPI0039A4ED57
MANSMNFNAGEVLFRQGEVSSYVLWVRHGEIEILREHGDASVLIGHVRGGEWLGEMGVIEHRRRSATARASMDGTAEVLSAEEFLDRVSRDATLARDLIQRLSIRLRTIEDRITNDLLPEAPNVASSPAGVEGDEALPDEIIPSNAPVALIARSDALRAWMGEARLSVERLPFVVGRAPTSGEAPPPRQPNLCIDDCKPFRLSRNHFMISRDENHLFINDLGSTLGTIVNGQAIGQHFMRDSALLRFGDNHLIAGGWGSPFDFTISVG